MGNKSGKTPDAVIGNACMHYFRQIKADLPSDVAVCIVVTSKTGGRTLYASNVDKHATAKMLTEARRETGADEQRIILPS